VRAQKRRRPQIAIGAAGGDTLNPF
jgi:hypothetical protein